MAPLTCVSTPRCLGIGGHPKSMSSDVPPAGQFQHYLPRETALPASLPQSQLKFHLMPMSSATRYHRDVLLHLGTSRN